MERIHESSDRLELLEYVRFECLSEDGVALLCSLLSWLFDDMNASLAQRVLRRLAAIGSAKSLFVAYLAKEAIRATAHSVNDGQPAALNAADATRD
jgi:hypothetical protein